MSASQGLYGEGTGASEATGLFLMMGAIETRSKMHSVICMLIFSERMMFSCMTGCLSSSVVFYRSAFEGEWRLHRE